MTQYGTDLLLNILVEDSPNGLYLVGRDSKLKYVNNRIAEWLGATSRDDLQTPIRHIYSFGELLEKRSGGSMDEKSKLFLQNILDSSQSMSALIEGLLSFSRIGRSEINKTRIELVHLVEAVRDDLMLECAGRDIEWKIGENCELYADIQLIRLVA
ncbi:MAG: hypothetical protein ISS19_09720, partial [Bacteroidales bacterium]|nr:hypothetical protein [Bacteroidales bacterium]